ncbi:MAG TPA: metallophosphoesterase family protein [Steroidobacteraceae bacterium]|nr:metallophosphoesterase family protein [Steroidobacteraceae bacterium]
MFDAGLVLGAFVIMVRVGLISDTHGLLRPEASAFLRGCSHIVHGGDIGSVDVLHALSTIAPVTAVRGNNDKGSWAEALPETELIKLGEVSVYVLHDLAQLDIEPRAAGVRVVVSGHSHKPCTQERRGVLYINPGSAGPRRFKLPVTVAELDIAGRSVTSRIVELVGQRA